MITNKWKSSSKVVAVAGMDVACAFVRTEGVRREMGTHFKCIVWCTADISAAVIQSQLFGLQMDLKWMIKLGTN